MAFHGGYKLKSKTNLLGGKGLIPKNKKLIALHCIAKPSENIVIQFHDDEIIHFPPDAFVPGGIYNFAIKQINEEGCKCFIGLTN